jgi:hypothetical protein
MFWGEGGVESASSQKNCNQCSFYEQNLVEKIFVTRNGFFGEELFLKLANVNKIS